MVAIEKQIARLLAPWTEEVLDDYLAEERQTLFDATDRVDNALITRWRITKSVMRTGEIIR